MATRGIPAQMKLLRQQIAEIQKTLDEESIKRARTSEDVAKLWQRLRWLEKKVEGLLQSKKVTDE